MAKELHIYDIRRFDKDGIRKTSKGDYQFREGIIHLGFESNDFYMERAKRLYLEEHVDRIILLSPEKDRKKLEELGEKIMNECRNEWKRFPNDRLIKEDEYTFKDNIEIIDSERKGEKREVDIIQIDLISNLYFAAEFYLSRINETPDELSKNLVRILAGLYPKEWKELYKDIQHYDPRDVLEIIISMTSDKTLAVYFEFFHDIFVKKGENIERKIRRLEKLLISQIRFTEGFSDLYLILRIIHNSISSDSVSKVLEIKDEIENYFRAVPDPEPYTDMLFRRLLQLVDFLQKYQDTRDFQDKLYFLEGSRKKIRESENLVENKFVEPFKTFYLDILKNWMDITFDEGDKLLGRSFLEANLLTRKATRKDPLLISLNVKNTGIGIAKNIKIILQNSDKYKIIGESSKEIDALRRNRDVDVEFQIRPLREERINLTFLIYYDDNQILVDDTLIFVEQEEFIPVPNPYNFTRPAEGDMFFDREDLFQWMESNMKGPTIYQNVLITGQRRTGKTSFLKQLVQNLRPSHYCIFSDLEFFPSLNDVDFLFEVCQELYRTFPDGNSPPDLQEFTRKSYLAFGNYIRSFLSNISDSKRIILIFDEFDKVESKIKEGFFSPGFLTFFRAFLQHNTRVSAVVGGNFDFDKLNSSEWQEFFTIFNPKVIGALDENSATALIRRPVKDSVVYDSYALKKILDFSGRNPFYIQLLCHTLVNYLNERREKNFIEIGDITTAVLIEAREKAEPTLRQKWEELDSLEKSTLCTLSRLKAQYKRAIELKEIGHYMRQNNMRIKKWNLFSILEAFVEKEILKKSGESSLYDFNIFLFEDWILEHGTLIGE